MLHKLKFKPLVKKLKTDLKEMDLKDPKTLAATVSFLSIPFLIGAIAFVLGGFQGNDVGRSAIMLMTPQMNSGGTGVILQSTDTESTILTNAHVCRVVKNGGVAVYKGTVLQVASYLEAKQSDLCLVKVNDDLGVNTKIASHGPRFYDKAIISGFPALMPNIITEGHVSGRSIIEVVTEIRACSEEEKQNLGGILCLLLGGIPTVKAFESVLVSATIMPGSSGSGVYNSSKELEGLVFAGSGQIGYGWTVPYEQMVNFLTKEVPKSEFMPVKNEMNPLDRSPGGRLKDLKERCERNTQHNEIIDNVCKALNRDLIWEN